MNPRIYNALICAVCVIFVACNGVEKRAENMGNMGNITDSAQSVENGDFKIMTIDALHSRLTRESPTIIAAMPRGIYTLGFIKGAKNIGFGAKYSGIWENDALDSATMARFVELLGDKKGEIVVYDNGDGGAFSAIAWAKKLGYANIAYLEGGLPKWRAAGYEVSYEMPKCCQM